MKYSEMTDTELFILALDKAGYIDVEPSEESIKDCFMDYIDCGQFPNVDIDDYGVTYYDNEEITVREMAINLIRSN